MTLKSTIDPGALARALSLNDLSDPADGPHAMQSLLQAVVTRLRTLWRCAVVVHRASPLTTVADNYDRLRYPADGVARDARYTRYLAPGRLLRTHTTAMIPPLLRTLAATEVRDVLLVCPGLVYRRDCIDRLHTGEPHQVDLWRLRRGPALSTEDLEPMMAAVVDAAVPGARMRARSTAHPYTEHGRELEVERGDAWIEIGECGVVSPEVLRGAGLPPDVSGLAMGLGLDRLLMVRKGIDDVRLLRCSDPRVRDQMQDLSPYRPVSSHPAIRRDLSVAVDADATPEELGDRVRAAMGDEAACIESVTVRSETSYAELPASAITRMGIAPHQKNVLLAVVIRDLHRTLTAAEANRVRDRIYAAIHEGSAREWADPFERPR